MRWLILALSLGTTLATLWRGIMLFITNLGTVRTASSSPFWWAMALCVASLFGFIGGVLAFNQKAISLIFFLAATIMTFFGYSSGYVLAFSFAVISVLTVINLIIHRRSNLRIRNFGFNDERYEEEYDEDEEHEEDDDEEEHEPTPVKTMKMPKRRSSLMAPDSDSLVIKPPQRQRETKVCLSCGIDIPISYKFCPSCGTELHAPLVKKLDVMLEDTAEEAEEEVFKIFKPEKDAPKYDFKRKISYSGISDMEEAEEDESKEDDIEINEPSISSKTEDVEVVPVVRKILSEEIPEEMEENQDSDDVPFKPLSVPLNKKQRKFEVDNSYQSFGRYTQSRKRRKVSMLQRTLLSMLVLGLVGSVGWFMYRGINRVPPPDRIEIPVTRISPEITEDINISENMHDGDEALELAIPNQAGSLPYMEVSPARQIITTGSGVNLRENHTTNSRAITRVNANNTYTLLERWKAGDVSSLPTADRNLPGDGTWYRIQAGNNAGWIYGQFALPLDGRAASFPTGYTEALLNSFGSNREEIEERLGSSRQQIRGDATVLEYTNLRITLRQNRVQGIQITGRGHNLVNSLAVGMTFDEMTAIIGAPNRYRDGALLYLETANLGVAVRRENDGRIRSINVGGI